MRIIAAPDITSAHKLQRIVDYLAAQGCGLVCLFLQRGELDGFTQRITYLHVIITGRDIGIVRALPAVSVSGIQLDLNPAIQLGDNRITLLLGDLGPDLGIGVWLCPDVQTIGIHNRHQGGCIHSQILCLLPHSHILGICRHITGNGARLDLVPAIQRFQDLAGRLARQLTDDIRL